MPILITDSTIKIRGDLYNGPESPNTLYVKCSSCGHCQSTPIERGIGFSGRCPHCGGSKVNATISNEPPDWMA